MLASLALLSPGLAPMRLRDTRHSGWEGAWRFPGWNVTFRKIKRGGRGRLGTGPPSPRHPRCDIRRNKGIKERDQISNLRSGGVLRGKGVPRERGGVGIVRERKVLSSHSMDKWCIVGCFSAAADVYLFERFGPAEPRPPCSFCFSPSRA